MLLFSAGVLCVIFAGVVVFGAPYVPTHRKDLRHLLDYLNVDDSDFLVDIGSGDGVVLREATKRGARSLGYEINPLLVIFSRAVSFKNRKKITIRQTNFWRANLPAEATIFYTFCDGRHIDKIFKLVQKFAKDNNKKVKFVSYGFKIKDKKIKLVEVAGFSVYEVTPE